MAVVENVWRHSLNQINHVYAKSPRMYEIQSCQVQDAKYADALAVTLKIKKTLAIAKVNMVII